MKLLKSVPYLFSLMLIINFESVNAHTNDSGLLVVNFVEFIMINIFILILCLGLVYLIDQFQINKKLISVRKLILIVVVTLVVNAIIAINTYMEIK
ncbi:MAG: hypothetical protein HeimC2_17660 [Candidatus Heimdallarchaeota archaeon LC_2]|nr:MAG: hypothetical protein HeimC2_17660 [Candidatus Heimdallarchaeota archaeon LC_2]